SRWPALGRRSRPAEINSHPAHLTMSDEKKKDEKPKKAAPGAALEANGDAIVLSEKAGGSMATLAGVGLFGVGGAIALGDGLFGAQFQHAYLAAYMWGLSVFVGGVWWVTLQHLFGSRASVAYRRIGEL